MQASLLATLQSPRRREILRLCWHRPVTAGEIHRQLGDVTFGAVSQQLRKLREAGLVEVRPDGQQRHYRTRRQALGPLRRWLEASWDDALYRLKLAAELEATPQGPAAPRTRDTTNEAMNDLPHDLTRSLVIHATRELVFRYFTDTERFARWWGEGSTIDGRVGGAVVIRYPNDIVARGEITALEPDRRIAFTYGYENSHPELPPGSSLVTIELHDHEDGTHLEFRHQLPIEKMRDQHVPGWRYHLAVFANVTADEHHASMAEAIDRWFAAWAEADEQARSSKLESCVCDEVELRDRHACLVGRDELNGHIANTQAHLPGITMRPDGKARHCQGTALVDWTATGPEGKPVMQGTHVIRCAPDGRIRAVTGIS